jgi:hypothetical protein
MPKRTFCQHPTRHTNLSEAPKVQRLASRRLAEFICARYDLEADDVSGLCAKCHAFESRQMKDDEDMEYEACISSIDEMSNEDEREPEEEKKRKSKRKKKITMMMTWTIKRKTVVKIRYLSLPTSNKKLWKCYPVFFGRLI